LGALETGDFVQEGASRIKLNIPANMINDKKNFFIALIVWISCLQVSTDS
jgi:hypothetical protein